MGTGECAWIKDKYLHADFCAHISFDKLQSCANDELHDASRLRAHGGVSMPNGHRTSSHTESGAVCAVIKSGRMDTASTRPGDH